LSADPPGPKPGRGTTPLVASLVAFAALLPFLRGLLAGGAFYFRDLALYFFPLRRFVVEGLRAGEVRFWNPYAHEGELVLAPVSYPLDLLQVLLPDERGFTLLMALHIPLAAIAFFALGRESGLTRTAAAGGAIVYSLGGFCLSTVNLYIYLPAMAWAPLVILGLVQAARCEGRRIGMAAFLIAVALTTTGAEIVAQSVLVGVVLARPARAPRPWLGLGAALILGAGLAAFALAPLITLVEGSARASGFATEVVTGHSIHPVTLVQVVVGSLYGDLSQITDRWWGQNFFPLGFPYFLSLYLGPTVLALAALGARLDRRFRIRLVVLALAALVLSLGHFVGLDALVAAWPGPIGLRYPSKAFFTVHFAAAFLAACGLDALARVERSWRLFAALALSLALPLVAAPTLPTVAPRTFRWLASGFFPPFTPWPGRLENAAFVLRDAATGGLVTLSAGVLALLVLARWVRPTAGCRLVALLVGADLLRAGAGLNPMVDPAFFTRRPAILEEHPEIGSAGRVFTCDTTSRPSFEAARGALSGSREIWTFAVLAETLTPHFNVHLRVPTAWSPDLTMLIPVAGVLGIDEDSCSNVAALVDRLRSAGVTHVVSLDPIEDPQLAALPVVAPDRIRPLVVRVYALRDPIPLRAVASDAVPAGVKAPPGSVVVEGLPAVVAGAHGRVLSSRDGLASLDLEVETDRPSVLVVRDTYGVGWKATVGGHPAPVWRADGRHRAVPIPEGRSRVVLGYSPPHFAQGVAISLASAILVAGLARRGRKQGTSP
jgi:hypothetical protein